MLGIHDGDGEGPRRRRAGKSASRRKADDGGKVKATFRLSREAKRRIDVHAACLDVDGSALVESLVLSHLRRFRVQDMGEPAADPGPPRGGAEGEGPREADADAA